MKEGLIPFRGKARMILSRAPALCRTIPRMRTTMAIVATVGAALMLYAAPASAFPAEPGCERIPILGLDPHVRKICDGSIQPDGSWTRYARNFWLQQTRSSCGGRYYQGGNCPPWMQNDTIPARQGPMEEYRLTADTVPPGEPGHIPGG